MTLLGGWSGLLEEAKERQPGRTLLVCPLDLPRASAEVRVVGTAEAARELVRDLQSTSLSALALAYAGTEALAATGWASEGTVFSAVLDLSAAGVPAAVEGILRLRVPLVVHDAKPLLLALWRLGLDPVLPPLFDTRLAAACLSLGSHHPRAAGRPARESEAEEIGRREALEAEREHFLTLEEQCRLHEVALPIPPGASATIAGTDARMLAARAIWTLHLYAAQQAEILRQGIHAHLHTIEFPFALANARMEFRGVHVDHERYATLREACERACAYYADELQAHGVDPPGSDDAFQRRMEHLGHGDCFPSLDDGALEAAEGVHPAVRAFRLHRRYRQLARQAWEIGPDGRVHPEHVQLGAATGRNSCRRPNLTGIGRVLRPVVTAPHERALVELDYGQIEVGVAAAEHDDPDLLDAYNSGDVYAAAAQRFFEGEIPDGERSLDPREFRRRRPELREAMKPFVLSVLYGGGPETIAARFGISPAEAERRIERFLELFPRLRLGLAEEEAFGLIRGHASIVSGLRRRVDPCAPIGWVRRVFRNTPIQGGAAVVFKKAIADLDRAFRGTDVWPVLPLHDAVLMECPAGEIDEVAERARRIMEDALRAYYPKLLPRVEVNKAHPECWNKDGHADSLDRFLADPEFRLDHYAGRRTDRKNLERPAPSLFDAVVAALGGVEVQVSERERAVPFHADLRDAAEGEMQEGTTACRVCGGRKWWRLEGVPSPRGAPWTCARCHPSLARTGPIQTRGVAS